ncbi:MAG: Na+/H+ antiporter NhaC family protein, partial [Atribacterota bacterium]|nr:Na+/H+ antiporter NhaC family protein [Atribacterota bacterium]
MLRKNNFNRYVIAIITVLIVLSFLSAIGWANGEGEEGNYGLWSLVPPILAIILCIVLKEALISLIIAVLVGATILNSGNLWIGLENTANILIEQVADSWNASIIL